MKSLKFILSGIVLILSSLYFMGMCIISNSETAEGIALLLFILGLIFSGVGLFFIKDD